MAASQIEQEEETGGPAGGRILIDLFHRDRLRPTESPIGQAALLARSSQGMHAGRSVSPHRNPRRNLGFPPTGDESADMIIRRQTSFVVELGATVVTEKHDARAGLEMCGPTKD